MNPPHYPARPVECARCREHFIDLHATMPSAVSVLIAWLTTAFLRRLSINETISQYLDGFHTCGHTIEGTA